MATKFLQKPVHMTIDDLKRDGKSLRESADMSDIGDWIEAMGNLPKDFTFHGTVTMREKHMDRLNKIFAAGLRPVIRISPIWDTRRDEKDVSVNNDSG
jgi:hypothetical protein